jgi:hypothetical protein
MAYPLRTVDATPESSPEAQAPSRPATVPASAVWKPDDNKWEVSRKDDQGARDGECLFYRDDGTLFSRVRFTGGVQDGPFVVYHPNGDVAREGTYVSGRLDGIVTAYASERPGAEKIRVCCVPPGAARLCERYRAGEFLVEVFYDREGRAILSDGRLCPARPDGLPELAAFDESRGGWAMRSPEIDRFWTERGVLVEEIANPRTDGVRTIRHFDATGLVRQEAGFTREDRPQGPFYRRFPDSEPSPYADQTIRQERGAYDAGQATGRWSLLDADGAVVRTIDRGIAVRDGDEARWPALVDARGDWLAQARALEVDGRVREAFVAAARGAAASGDHTAFDRLRAEHVVPLAADREAQWGEALSQSTDANLASILDALICGADAAAVLRALASVLPPTGPAAIALVEASLLLAPDRRMTHLTRALLRFQQGDRAGALADADVVAGESDDVAESLRSYGAIVFRAFDDWPGDSPLTPHPELANVVLEIGHGVGEIRRAVAVYATRIERVRAALSAVLGAAEGNRVASVDWLPPDLSSLLPEGPVVLRRETIECDPDPEGPPPQTTETGEPVPETIEIDEELAVDGAGVPALLATAHADWAALSWLCWAVGLDRVALPGAVSAPGEIATAMQMIVHRTWRIKDRLATGSLLSRSRGVPGFEWQGVAIDALPRRLAEMGTAEYVTIRSMFLWLVTPDALSPYQDDLRDV